MADIFDEIDNLDESFPINRTTKDKALEIALIEPNQKTIENISRSVTIEQIVQSSHDATDIINNVEDNHDKATKMLGMIRSDNYIPEVASRSKRLIEEKKQFKNSLVVLVDTINKRFKEKYSSGIHAAQDLNLNIAMKESCDIDSLVSSYQGIRTLTSNQAPDVIEFIVYSDERKELGEQLDTFIDRYKAADLNIKDIRKIAKPFRSGSFKRSSFLKDSLKAKYIEGVAYAGLIDSEITRLDQHTVNKARELDDLIEKVRLGNESDKNFDGYARDFPILFSDRVREYNDLNRDVSSKLRQKESELNGYQEKLGEYRTAEQQRRHELSKKEKKLQDYRSRIDSLSSKNEAMRESYQERIDDLRKMLDQKADEEKSLESGYQEKIYELQAEMNRKETDRKAQMSDLEDELTELKKQLDGTSSSEVKVKELEERLDTMHKTYQKQISFYEEQLQSRPEDIDPVEKTYSFPEDNQFYVLAEVFRNDIVRSSWTDKFTFISQFIDKKDGNNEYLRGDDDFRIVEHVYDSLKKMWQDGEFGLPKTPVTGERLKVSDTLTKMHGFIEKSRAIYGPGILT